MIDFLIGLALGVVATLLFNHFKGETPAKAFSEISTLKQELSNHMSQLGDEITQKITAAAGAIAGAVDAKVSAAVAAEKADHDADLSNIGTAVDTLQAAVPAGD